MSLCQAPDVDLRFGAIHLGLRLNDSPGEGANIDFVLLLRFRPLFVQTG